MKENPQKSIKPLQARRKPAQQQNATVSEDKEYLQNIQNDALPLSATDISNLQGNIGNQAVMRLLNQKGKTDSVSVSSLASAHLQRVGGTNEFANDDRLNEHFDKHVTNQQDAGDDYADGDAYEKAAKAIIDGDHDETRTGGDGTTYYWKNSTEQIVAVRGGILRTMFVPTRGKAYFDDRH